MYIEGLILSGFAFIISCCTCWRHKPIELIPYLSQMTSNAKKDLVFPGGFNTVLVLDT